MRTPIKYGRERTYDEEIDDVNQSIHSLQKKFQDLLESADSSSDTGVTSPTIFSSLLIPTFPLLPSPSFPPPPSLPLLLLSPSLKINSSKQPLHERPADSTVTKDDDSEMDDEVDRDLDRDYHALPTAANPKRKANLDLASDDEDVQFGSDLELDSDLDLDDQDLDAHHLASLSAKPMTSTVRMKDKERKRENTGGEQGEEERRGRERERERGRGREEAARERESDHGAG